MSVLIEDMEKPKFCYAIIDGKFEYCPFVNTDDDDCVLLLEKGICERTWQGQYSKCPLVEAPESCDDAVSRKAVYVVIEEVLYETTKGADNWYGLLNDGVRTLSSVTPKPQIGELVVGECEDTVSREAVIEEIKVCFNMGGCDCGQCDSIIEHINSLPPVTPKRKTGKWKKIGHWGRCYRCDQCGNILDFDGVNAGRGDANFCPNCGAEMDGSE